MSFHVRYHSRSITEDQKSQIDAIIIKLADGFPSFGGGQTSQYNLLVNALKAQAPIFAAGVDIRQVVEFVVMEMQNGQ